MKKYSFKCSCGDVATVDANSKEEGVQKIKDMTTQDWITKHFADKHPGQPAITVEEALAHIDEGVYEEPAAPAPAM